ncbi:MAG: flagellar export chaperone FlgN [Deltaproteobacteria bacterium]|nr:flagellar export chaperone FlgN [Deltaproteobacteria bacterium]
MYIRMREMTELLRAVAGLYEDLLAVMGRERRALIRFKPAEAAAAAAEKEELLRRMEDLEKQRLTRVDVLARTLGVPAAALTLEFLAQRSSEPLSGELRRCREVLGRLVGRLREENRRSNALCCNAVELLQGAYRLLQGFMVNVPVYHRGGGFHAARLSGKMVRDEA